MRPTCCAGMQTVATQSNLTIKRFQAGAHRDQADARGMADRLELDGTYHNLAIFFDRVGKFTRIVNISALEVKGKDKPVAELDDHAPAASPRRSCCSTSRGSPAKPGASQAPAPRRGPEMHAHWRSLSCCCRRVRRARAPAASRVAGSAHAGAATPARPPRRLGRAAAARKPPSPENYTYDAGGRRDPFLNLLGTGTDPRPASKPGEGAAGMTVGEICVRGIMQSRERPHRDGAGARQQDISSCIRETNSWTDR